MNSDKLVIEQFLVELINDLKYKDYYTLVYNKIDKMEYDLGALPTIDLLNLTTKDKNKLIKMLESINIELIDFKIFCKLDYNNNDLLIFPYIKFKKDYILKIHYEFNYNIILSFIRQIDFVLNKFNLL